VPYVLSLCRVLCVYALTLSSRFNDGAPCRPAYVLKQFTLRFRRRFSGFFPFAFLLRGQIARTGHLLRREHLKFVLSYSCGSGSDAKFLSPYSDLSKDLFPTLDRS